MISFWVGGNPKGQPRTKAFSRGGHAGVYDPGTANDWKVCIWTAAKNKNIQTLKGPVTLALEFRIQRPKGHVRADGESVRPSAPKHHTQRPDIDNLVKCVMDALTMAQVWEDDTQVFQVDARKIWTETGPGLHVAIEQV